MTDEIGVQSTGSIGYMQETMDKMFASAHVNAVFGKAVRQGDTLIIPAAEIFSFSGFGMGEGSGPAEVRPAGESEGEPAAKADEKPVVIAGRGSGGGGGGQTFARPVAVIVVGSDGVHIKPVIDMTKIGLAVLTTFGFMLATLARLRRGG